ncbi:MAG: flagellar hook protein, partial [Oscillospiraceae bacterium]|nr:flagellar hook protein [Oscillospiraceae bacterium]
VTSLYDPSLGDLTYSDNLILQTNSRTKDAVNFTFRYSSPGIGELTCDLDCSAAALGMSALTLSAQENANLALDSIDNALNKVSMVRACFGSIQNRLEKKVDNITVTSENITESESHIRDTDMAITMMNFTKAQIVQQAAQSMLAQSNVQPQQVLQLMQ